MIDLGVPEENAADANSLINSGFFIVMAVFVIKMAVELQYRETRLGSPNLRYALLGGMILLATSMLTNNFGNQTGYLKLPADYLVPANIFLQTLWAFGFAGCAERYAAQVLAFHK